MVTTTTTTTTTTPLSSGPLSSEPNNVKTNLLITLFKKRRTIILYLIKCLADLIHASDGVFDLEKYKFFVTVAALTASVVGLYFVWKKEKGTD